jgi:hypothetical protein
MLQADNEVCVFSSGQVRRGIVPCGLWLRIGAGLLPRAAMLRQQLFETPPTPQLSLTRSFLARKIRASDRPDHFALPRR